MRLKRLLMFVLTALMLVSLMACDSDNNKKADAESTKSKKSLKVYYMDYDWNIQTALAKFREKYNDVDVEDNIFYDENDYKTRLTTDILSGGGPDVITVQTFWFNEANRFWSNGVLCDLNEFIRKDKEFNLSDYNEKVLNSFEQDGKRLMIPLAFRFETFFTSKQALQRNNIKIDPSNWSYYELLKIAKKFQTENKGKKKYFFNHSFSISNMINSSGVQFVDYKNKKSLFDSKDFVDILEIYKGLYPSICPQVEEKDIPYVKCLKEDVFIMEINPYNNYSTVSGVYMLYKSLGNEMELYTLPSLKGENSSIVSYAGEAVGINSQSKNKDAAYDFIKILMSKELQKSGDHSNVTIQGAPILNASYKEDAEFYMSKEYGDGSSFLYEENEIKRVPLSEGLKIQLDGMNSKVDKCVMEDKEIFNIVEEALPDFLNGRKTAAQTVKEIDDKVNLYLNE